MTTEHVPELYALTVEPRYVRAGGTVDIAFRTRNLGASPTAPALVCFALDAGLSALGPIDVPIEPVPPGDDLVATVRARVPETCDDRTTLAVGAALVAGDTRVTTNVCTVVVRSRPVLDGPGGGTYVEKIGDDTVRVRAVVVNEGDGPAHDVRLEVPVPDGCVAAPGATPARATARLDPGAALETIFDVRIAEPAAFVACDAARVTCANALSAILSARTSAALHPSPAARALELTAQRRGVDVAFAVVNDGWVEARDVRAEVAFPATLRLIEGSVTAGGVPAQPSARRRDASAAFARVEAKRGGCRLVVASIPARARVRIALSLAVPAPGARGDVSVALGGGTTTVSFATPVRHDVRLHVLDVPRAVPPDGVARIAAVLVNAGDEAVAVRCVAERAGDPVSVHSTIDVRACSLARFVLDVAVPADAPDGSRVEAFVVASGDDGEYARTPVAVRIRETRATTAAGEPAIDEPAAPDVDVALRVPERVTACAAFDAVLEITAHDDADRIAVRAPIPTAARYALGSCRIGATRLHDVVEPGTGAASSPLASDDGVELRGIRAGTAVAIAWTLVALDPAEHTPLTVDAAVTVDGDARVPASRVVHVDARPSFAVRPSHLPFHVAGCSVAAPPAMQPLDGAIIEPAAPNRTAASPTPNESALLSPADDVAAAGETKPPAAPLTLVLDGDRVDAIARLHHALRGPGLLAHLFVLRLFFPTVADAHDPRASAFDDVRIALDDVFDRLYVKLRIPGFDVSADDLDDPQLRAACDAIFAGVPSLRALPCGSPAVLRALVATLGVVCDDPRLAHALEAHARALDGALAAYDGLPLEVFDDALARRGDRALEDARQTLLDALAPYAAARVPC